jgi:hypothetical protein
MAGIAGVCDTLSCRFKRTWPAPKKNRREIPAVIKSL